MVQKLSQVTRLNLFTGIYQICNWHNLILVIVFYWLRFMQCLEIRKEELKLKKEELKLKRDALMGGMKEDRDENNLLDAINGVEEVDTSDLPEVK